MTTKRQATLITEAKRELREARSAERQAIDSDCSTETAWRFAARCDKAARKLEAALAGIELPEPRTKRSMARAAFIALGNIGRAFVRIAQQQASIAKMKAANLARKAARLAAVAARASLRRVIAVIASVALFLATTSNAATNEEITMKSTKKSNAKKSTKNVTGIIAGKFISMSSLSLKERALLRELSKHSNSDNLMAAVDQSLLFKAFERKSAVKAKSHERAGWDVRNSSRKLIAEKLAVRVERGTLRLTQRGLDVVRGETLRSVR